MKNLFKKGWFQMVFFGAIIGAALIVLDNKFHFLTSKPVDRGDYHGPVSVDKDKMYFTTAEYPEITFDFGKVKEGDTVLHAFKLRNTGKEPLFVYKAKASCDCMKVFFNTDPIPPGGETEVRIGFLSKGRKGKQIRTAIVDTNTDPVEMTLTLTGMVE